LADGNLIKTETRGIDFMAGSSGVSHPQEDDGILERIAEV
jgi:hypothetical protein